MPSFGCFVPTYAPTGGIDPQRVRDVAVAADEHGLDHVWVGDHFLWNTGMLSPLPALAYIAAATSRVRLGTGVYLVNLRHPSLTAKDAATVDVLSEGRLILGIGVGGDNPAEYAAVGVDHADRGRRMDETMDALRVLFRRGSGFDGRLISIPPFDLDPLPRQDPLPLWVGGRADVVVRRAATRGQGWFPVWVSADRIAAARAVVLEERGSLDGFAIALNVFTGVADTRDAGRELVADHLGGAYRLPFEKFERYAAYGTPDDVVAALRPYLDAGVTDLVFNLVGPDPQAQLERVVESVLPRLAAAATP